eukprot:1050148-Pyramimonas_sp.AAC.1
MDLVALKQRGVQMWGDATGFMEKALLCKCVGYGTAWLRGSASSRPRSEAALPFSSPVSG